MLNVLQGSHVAKIWAKRLHELRELQIILFSKCLETQTVTKI